MPSFMINKRTLTAHWRVFRSFLLLSSGAALIAYSLSLLCFYPYPITVSELITVFLKVLLLSSFIASGTYFFAFTAKLIWTKLFTQLVRKSNVDIVEVKMPVPDLFTAVSLVPSPAMAETILCC